MWVARILLFVALLSTFIWVALQNTQLVDVRVFTKTFLGIRLFVVMFLSVLLGFIAGLLLAAMREVKLRMALAREHKAKVGLEQEIGGLRAAPNRLEPGDASTGALAAADIDRDGDLDLFAGSRSVPGRYPERPRSRLLLNQQGKLLEAPDGLAPGLGSVGLVTGALFTDVDRDGWPDLLVTCEWGAVELFRNHQGKLRRETEAAGLGARLGWWNGVTAFDVDGDGDQDYLCANVGTNTKYHASPEKPAQLFFGDFDGSGERHLVEAKRAEGELLPVRGLSCSSEAMPWIAEKLPTFDAFASSSLDDIYTPEGLGSALTLEASELRSGVLINGSTPGHPAFEWRPLPWQAQLAPVQGVAAADFDADGHGDLLLAQNFFWREPETGRWNGGLGLLLRGDGAGWLAPAAPEHSGYVVRGDARALVVHAGASVRVLTALNDGGLRVHRPRADLRALRLAGLQSNSIAAGARVLVDGRAVELAAGQGKASQNGPVVLVPRDLERAAVEWPDGTRREYALREDHGPGAEPGPAVLRRGP